MLSKLKNSCRSLFNLLASLLRRSVRWILKKLMRVVSKYPHINMWLKKYLTRFPKLQNYLYNFYRCHVLKIAHQHMASEQKYVVGGIDWNNYSPSAQKIYQQLINLKRSDKI